MNKIENCDAFNFLKNIETNTINLILIDPPYIISKDSGFSKGNISKDEYKSKYGKYTIDFGEWDKQELDLDNLFNQFYRILNPSGTLIMFYDIWKMQEIKEIAEKYKFKQPRLCCWNKTNPVPVNSKLNYLTNAKEYFCTFTKISKPTFNSEYDNGDYFSDTYIYPICHGKERTKHPTQKPLELIKQLVLKHSNENDVVLDCFLGSGTTAVASLETNRKFLGCEINEKYFNIAKERLKI